MKVYILNINEKIDEKRKNIMSLRVKPDKNYSISLGLEGWEYRGLLLGPNLKVWYMNKDNIQYLEELKL